METFKLVSLSIRQHPVFHDKIIFDFSDPKEADFHAEPYITLILGPNGTGKSNVLRLLIEIFKLAYEKKVGHSIVSYPQGKYNLEYLVNGARFNIVNTLGWFNGEDKPEDIGDPSDDRGIRFFRNGKEIEREELQIPNAILASSFMLNDKYLFNSDPDSFPIYKYLGLRRNENTAGTRSYITQSIDLIFQAAKNESFLDGLKTTLRLLNLEESFSINYYPRYKSIFFKGNLSEDKFNDFFRDYTKYLQRSTKPWNIDVYNRMIETEPDVVPRIVDLINYIAQNLIQEYPGSKSKYFNIDILAEEKDIYEKLNYLPYLKRLDLITFPSITLKKQSGYYDIGESSSGELHIITSIINLFGCIKQNALILIDEPEVSLHPNWQMKYIDLLNKAFKNFASAHFVICSHSHFLVSDLKPLQSNIISLKRGTPKDELELSLNKLISTTIPFETYGWSAEQVLLEVFDTPTTRNFFIAERLSQIFKSATTSEEPNIEQYKQELLHWRSLLRENDPLHYTIDQLVKRMGWQD